MARIQQAVTNFTVNGQVGPWLRFDYYEPPFDLGLLVAFGNGLAGTLAIDYILDDMSQASLRQVSISQAVNTVTVTDNGPPLGQSFGGGQGHCLATGDTAILTGTPGGSVDGIYSVTVISPTVYTVTAVASQTLATQLATVVTGRVLQASATDNVIKLAPVTARASIGVTVPIFAARLHMTAFTSAGLAALVAIQGGASS
jgi:hypothetical protein